MTIDGIDRKRPAALPRFEIAFLLAMALYPAVIPAGRHLAPPFDWPTHGLLLGAMIAAQILAMILVARWRKKWARWLICLLLLLDVPLYMVLVPDTGLQSPTFLGLSLLQFALHCTAVFLLFSPSASAWLVSRSRHPSA